MMKKQLILFLMIFYALNVRAQDSNWSVDASKYQYSMTFNAFLNVNGFTLSSIEDKVGAFVNGEVRGAANVTYVASVDKYVVYLSVYANTSGEIINFRIFNKEEQSVSQVIDTQKFVIDSNVGGIFQTYSIASPALKNEAVLSSFAFSGVTVISQNISVNKIDIVLPSNTDVANLSAEFAISAGASFFVDNQKQVSGTSTNDFTSTVKYKLLSENQAVLLEYDVSVTVENTNINPPEILLKSDVYTFVKQAPVLISMETNVVISNFEVEDILLTNAVVASIKKENEFLYMLEIVPIQQGEFSIEIPENVVFNDKNDGNLASNKLSFTYDFVRPYLLSIKRKNPVEEITKSDTLQFTVFFSESVENVFSTDFTSVDNAIFKVEKENNSTYTISINNIENYIGVVSLNLKSANNIQDKAGNLLMNSVINAHQN